MQIQNDVPLPYDGDKLSIPAQYTVRRPDTPYGEVLQTYYDSSVTQKKRRLTVLLPPGYDENRRYPVLYLCHGLGQDDTQFLVEGHADVILGNLFQDNLAQGMIVICPNCRAREDDRGDPPDAFSLANYVAFDAFLDDFTKCVKPFAEANFPIEASRKSTAVAGFSMGGREALCLGLKREELFGYIGAFCPAPGILPYHMNGIGERGHFTAETLKTRFCDTYLMIAAGKQDFVVCDHPESYHLALQKNNTPHDWYLFRGGHDFSVTGKALFLFAQKLFR